MLDVPGQQRKARRLWRHSLASALWSRQLALTVAREAGLSYLCGLLHNIGKAVTLGAAHDLARQSAAALSGEDYDRLVGTFHREVTARVVKAWHLPPPILAVVTRWDGETADAMHMAAGQASKVQTGARVGDVQVECDIVNVAHRLADCRLREPTRLSCKVLVREPAYRNLGLAPEDGMPLFDSAADITAELDRYLAP